MRHFPSWPKKNPLFFQLFLASILLAPPKSMRRSSLVVVVSFFVAGLLVDFLGLVSSFFSRRTKIDRLTNSNLHSVSFDYCMKSLSLSLYSGRNHCTHCNHC